MAQISPALLGAEDDAGAVEARNGSDSLSGALGAVRRPEAHEDGLDGGPNRFIINKLSRCVARRLHAS